MDLEDGAVAKVVEQVFDMRPYSIEKRLKLRNPIYQETAAYGHMGRKNRSVKKTFIGADGTKKQIEVELFTWEKLDFVEKLKKAFKL